MKKLIYVVIISLAYFLTACGPSMTIRTENGQLVPNNKDVVAKGTPTQMGKEIRNFNKDVAIAKMWERYQKLLSEERYFDAKLLRSEIMIMEERLNPKSIKLTKKYSNGKVQKYSSNETKGKIIVKGYSQVPVVKKYRNGTGRWPR